MRRRIYLLIVLAWMLAACLGSGNQSAAPELPVTGTEDLPAAEITTQTAAATQAPTQALPEQTEAAGVETAAPDTTAVPQATDETGGAEVSAADCTSPAALTPAMTEGPYYKSASPERTSLVEPETVGTRLVLTGTVLDTNCQPIPNVWLDFWQTDGLGEYDNAGYRLRGHQYTDEAGRYQLETVVPGLYPGRTAHIHVKVQAPGGPVLTTQLFFPDEPGNQGDRIFSPQLLVDIQDVEGGKQATYHFVVEN